jgi:hypothetical protein
MAGHMFPPAEREIQPISIGVRHNEYLMTFRCYMTSNRIAKAQSSVNLRNGGCKDSSNNTPQMMSALQQTEFRSVHPQSAALEGARSTLKSQRGRMAAAGAMLTAIFGRAADRSGLRVD